MKIEVTAQQTAFFTQNGYIEFEGIDFNPEVIFNSAKKTLASHLNTSPEKLPRESPLDLYRKGRDLWRFDEQLQRFLTHKLFPLASILDHQKSLRLACDQWIPADYTWDQTCCLKDLFSVQGLVIGALICFTESKTPLRRSLGLLPLPSKPSSILFFRSHLILDWPQLAECSPTDMYLVAYSLPNAVYVQNTRDPSTNDLKQFGYGFGDPLKNASHPLLVHH